MTMIDSSNRAGCRGYEPWRKSARNEAVALEAILNFGSEDGGTTIYGRRLARHPLTNPTWIFWLASSGFGIDDNGNEVHLTHRSEETTDLASLLPDAVFCYRPFLIHPEFAILLCEALDQHKAGLMSNKVYPNDEQLMMDWERLIAAADQKANGSA